VAVYSYRATTLDGKINEGTIEASDERTAVERLKDSGLIPLRVTTPRDSILKRFTFGVPRGDILTFTTELSALLKAGLPLDRSLNILSELSESKAMKEIIRSILQSIREGLSFSDALQKHPRVFPHLYVNMVRAGEAGGVLDVVLEKLREFLESAKELKDSLISAMIYPVILMFTGITSIIILLIFVLPKFSLIFSEMGATLPTPTRIVIGISRLFSDYWWFILLLIIITSILFRNYIKSLDGRYKWDKMKLKLMGDIIKRLETARFCRTLGTLLNSGVPLLQALNNAKGTINNRVIASVIDTVSKEAKEGKGISSSLSRSGVFPPLATSMIMVGEESGQLDTMLLQVAETYETSLRATLKRFLALLEPAMILFMAAIIGFIVLSMLMAIFSITQLPF